MTELFKKCIPVIFEHEGGLADHKNDPGGITKYGISLRFLKGLGYSIDGDLIGDIDGDGDVDRDDILAMTKDESEYFYFHYFWKAVYEKFNNDLLALNVFDFGVNAGTRTSAKRLQMVLGVSVDGIIGNQTLTALYTYKGDVVAEFQKKRKEFYQMLVNRNPDYNSFIIGWLRRVENCKF